MENGLRKWICIWNTKYFYCV